MRLILSFIFCLSGILSVWSQPDSAIRQKFNSSDYTVTWGKPRKFASQAKVVIGYGNGHGGTLGWLRFHPSKDGVELLVIEYDKGWRPYNSKWSPDVAPMTVKRGLMSHRAYATLLHKFSIVNSARLKPISRNSISGSSADFWVAAEVSHRNQSLVDFNWAGYASSLDEIDYVKPQAMVDLARNAIAKVALANYSLTPDDRSWASTKFVKDWKSFGEREFYWWVGERLLITIGVLGDKSVVPTLVEVIRRNMTGGPSDRKIYYAINAITRLTGRDVRPIPVEEMDLELTRQKVLSTLVQTQN